MGHLRKRGVIPGGGGITSIMAAVPHPRPTKKKTRERVCFSRVGAEREKGVKITEILKIGYLNRYD